MKNSRLPGTVLAPTAKEREFLIDFLNRLADKAPAYDFRAAVFSNIRESLLDDSRELRVSFVQRFFLAFFLRELRSLYSNFLAYLHNPKSGRGVRFFESYTGDKDALVKLKDEHFDALNLFLLQQLGLATSLLIKLDALKQRKRRVRHTIDREVAA